MLKTVFKSNRLGKGEFVSMGKLDVKSVTASPFYVMCYTVLQSQNSWSVTHKFKAN